MPYWLFLNQILCTNIELTCGTERVILATYSKMKKEIKETDKWAGKTLRPKKNVYRKRLAQKNKWLLGLAHVADKK